MMNHVIRPQSARGVFDVFTVQFFIFAPDGVGARQSQPVRNLTCLSN
jgi:hypothetical protein